MKNRSGRRLLLESIARFWHSYALSDEAEAKSLRRWSKESLERGVVGQALQLCDALAVADTGQRSIALDRVQDGVVTHLTGTREWLGIRLSFVGLVDDSDLLPSSLCELIQGLSASSLVLCVLPSSYIEAWQEFAHSVRAQGKFVISVFPSDLNALARGRWSLLDLIEYKLYRQFVLDKLDIEAQFDEVLYDAYVQRVERRRPTFLNDLDTAIGALADPICSN